jgi:hypothetical protein
MCLRVSTLTTWFPSYCATGALPHFTPVPFFGTRNAHYFFTRPELEKFWHFTQCLVRSLPINHVKFTLDQDL